MNNQKIIRYFIIFLVYLLVISIVNFYANAFSSELGATSDEPAHYLTVLMFIKYFGSSFPANPLHFFQDFYLHYPKIGLGNWPPAFYLGASLYGLVFGASIAKMMFLQCLIAAGILHCTFYLLSKVTNLFLALILPILLLLVFEWQKQMATFMLDHLIELEVTLVIILLLNFIKGQSAFSTFLLSLVVTVGSLTKGNFLFVYLWIPLVLVRYISFKDLRKQNLVSCFLPPVIFTFLWYHYTKEYRSLGWSVEEDITKYAIYSLKNIFLFITDQLSVSLVVLIFLLALLNYLPVLKRTQVDLQEVNKDKEVILYIVLMGIFSYIAFHLFIPTGTVIRHYVVLIPMLLLVLVIGFESLDIRRKSITSILIFTAFFTGVYSSNNFDFYIKRIQGSQSVVQYLEKESIIDDKILIASDPFGQGGMIVEFANISLGNNRSLIRSDKLLSNVNWSGSSYNAKYENLSELESMLIDNEINWVIVDKTVDVQFPEKHHFDLINLLPNNPNYKLEKVFPYHNRYKFDPEGLELYKIASND